MKIHKNIGCADFFLFFLIGSTYFYPSYSFSSDFEVRTVCELKSQEDVLIEDVMIDEGRVICKDGSCFGAIYKAHQVGGKDASKNKSFIFASPAQLQVGEVYSMYATKINSESRKVLLPYPGGLIEKKVSRDVVFFVPIDGAFSHYGDLYYRSVWAGCIGDANECKLISKYDSNLASGEIVVKDGIRCQVSP